MPSVTDSVKLHFGADYKLTGRHDYSEHRSWECGFEMKTGNSDEKDTGRELVIISKE